MGGKVPEDGECRRRDDGECSPAFDSMASNASAKPACRDDSPEEEHDKFPPLTAWQRRYAWFTSDVLLCILILNLASELVAAIRIDHFSNSLLVALVLKGVLSLIQHLEHSVKHLCCDKLGRKFVGLFFMWLIVFSSKFLILWIDDAIFGKQVDLAGFWSILILCVVLMVVEAGSRWWFRKLGTWERDRSSHSEVDSVV